MQEPVVSDTLTKKRLGSLDHLRGLAIFLMVIVNALSEYNGVPSWLKHAEWDGYTIADLVAPMFVFAMGVAYNLSFSKRVLSQGKGRAILHFIKRYSTLFVFGLIGSILVAKEVNLSHNVLQMLGFVGLFSLSFMLIEPKVRVLTAFALAVIYQVSVPFVADSGMFDLLATVSWSFILLFASALGKWVYAGEGWRSIKILAFWGAALALLGVLISFILPLNRSLSSLSYVLFSAGLSTFILLLFYVFTDLLSLRISVLDAMGKNALLLFMVSSLLTLVENAVIPSTASLLCVAGGSASILLVCIFIGVILDAKRIYLKL